MSGLDIEGVLEAHAPRRGPRDLRQHCVCGWDSEERAGKSAHRAHVAAVLREQIAQVVRKRAGDWLDSTSEVYARAAVDEWLDGLVRYVMNGPGSLAPTSTPSEES